MEKWDFARDMVDRGETNAVIIKAVKEKFGSGISTSKLAEWRATSLDRAAERDKAGRKELKRLKREFVKQCLDEGLNTYQTQQACRSEFGEGIGYETVQKIQAEMQAEVEEAVQPVQLPAEIMEDSEPEETGLTVTAPPPNGSLNNIKAVQNWMNQINAEELSLTRDGKLSVLVRHNFDLGEPE